MLLTKIKNILRPIKHFIIKPQDHFLSKVNGVVHIGANHGQERLFYDKHGLEVLWIEAIPEVYEQLINNIAHLPKQKAIQALLTDVNGKEYDFHIANNQGASSSIYDFKKHQDIWPDVNYTSTISLTSHTFSTVVETEQLDMHKYQALIMDTQGSELLVLKGALEELKYFDYIKTEVPDFESYQDCCMLKDIEQFMHQNGYKEINRHKFASNEEGGSYFDIVYKKQ